MAQTHQGQWLVVGRWGWLEYAPDQQHWARFPYWEYSLHARPGSLGSISVLGVQEIAPNLGRGEHW